MRGALIVESLRVGAVLEGSQLVILKLSRLAVSETTVDQPAVWTLIEFASEHPDAGALAELLAGVLDGPGWYANLESGEDVYVVFAGRVFRYERGDDARREEAETYARSVGVPAGQLDW